MHHIFAFHDGHQVRLDRRSAVGSHPCLGGTTGNSTNVTTTKSLLIFIGVSLRCRRRHATVLRSCHTLRPFRPDAGNLSAMTKSCQNWTVVCSWRNSQIQILSCWGNPSGKRTSGSETLFCVQISVILQSLHGPFKVLGEQLGEWGREPFKSWAHLTVRNIRRCVFSNAPLRI